VPAVAPSASRVGRSILRERRIPPEMTLWIL